MARKERIIDTKCANCGEYGAHRIISGFWGETITCIACGYKVRTRG